MKDSEVTPFRCQFPASKLIPCSPDKPIISKSKAKLKPITLNESQVKSERIRQYQLAKKAFR